ncbi:MAG: Rne/Rng family ribonuclease [Acidimicrobiia bacterium]|nr:Rne/Rng family ribonuclease [Acidimicrobiia bacterium]NNL13736.1 Rne/Rng family ribonuclease [Acidimicrobiia bacterium]RZV43492.1 MAG: Rne/Rng family ribonuclease [Acidimicrobiia bacterium]
MALFRRKTPQIVGRGSGQQAPPERKTRTVGGEVVEIARFKAPPEKPAKKTTKTQQKTSDRNRSRDRDRNRNRSGGGRGGDRSAARRGPRAQTEIIMPPETGRKQMIVRRMPHQTQIVVMEGPVLVEHYVARSDRKSLIGNVYLGRVRNVLPGMEAAFVDFGEGKNGVLYAADVQYDTNGNGRGRPRIEKALKNGDTIMVQVVKDAMGHKGARLTNEISMAGRHLVLVPDAEDRGGISRRLPDEERRRLRTLVNEAKPKGYGVIVRTAALGATKEDVVRDISRLQEMWAEIQEAAKTASAPDLLYREPPLVIRVIREHFTSDFKRLIVDDDDTKAEITKYLKATDPDLLKKVETYRDELPVFERYHIEDQLRKALDRNVWLPSGGHIVIEPTEALTVIDVNTGKFVGRSNLEETVLQNNLEAAEEIARQLRLRDIGGIIVIDFIDMESEKNRRSVLRKLQEELAKDKSRTQVSEVSSFGLVEMTRKHVSEGLVETFSEVCPTCSGRGLLLHEDAAALGNPIPESSDPESKKKG